MTFAAGRIASLILFSNMLKAEVFLASSPMVI
jgi:hypothetical protein